MKQVGDLPETNAAYKPKIIKHHKATEFMQILANKHTVVPVTIIIAATHLLQQCYILYGQTRPACKPCI